MRTTLAIDDDLLLAVKGLAARQHKSMSEMFCILVRQVLQPQPSASGKQHKRNGVHLLPIRPDGAIVTAQLVHQLHDELP